MHAIPARAGCAPSLVHRVLAVALLVVGAAGTATADDGIRVVWANAGIFENVSQLSGPLRDAMEARQSGKSRLAVSYARDVLSDGGSRPAERVAAAHILCIEETVLGHAERALRYCDRAVESSSDEERWVHHHNRANARLHVGDYAGAVADYEQALEEMPADAADRVVSVGGDWTQRRVVAISLSRARRTGGIEEQQTVAATPADAPDPGADAPEGAAADAAPAAPAPR